MTCDDCVHKTVCYRTDSVSPSYADKCGDFAFEKTGHWSHDGSHWKNRFICSECGYKLFDEPTNYCPNCAAKMVEPQESEK